MKIATNFHVIICTVLIINNHFQAGFESEGLRSQKISYYDNKKTVNLLLNVSCQLMDLWILAFNIQIGHLDLQMN